MLFGSRKQPKGPGKRTFYYREKNLSETIICFQAPKHNVYQENKRLDIYNIYENSQYNTWEIYGPNVLALSIFNECWNFNGLPIIDSSIADLRMSITLINTNNFGSLFSPDNLLNFDNQHILYEFGPENKSHRYDTHIDWKVINIHKTDWVFYKSISLTSSAENEMKHTFITPIEDDIALVICFIAITHSKGTQFSTVASDFIREIMKSFTVTLSPIAVRHKAEELASNPGSLYPDHKPKVHWKEKLHSELVSEKKKEELAKELDKIKEELGM